jgi:glucose/arabinose dehydrogenase
MHNARTSYWCAVTALVLFSILFPAPANAQFRGRPYLSGLTHPLAFVQDPSNPSVQYVVEQEGLIKVVVNHELQPTPFLDLSGVITTVGEAGLLGLAFPPDYAVSGRFYVNFVSAEGHSVVARFKRSEGDPLVADAGTRFDLRWSTGERFISEPQSGHYGGDLVFGADGYLYVGLGDGGAEKDLDHFAQSLNSLLGKFLRIDVNVSDADDEGFDVPADNPFVTGARPEIWSIGFRNPWRFSLDTPARGGTGALIIGDVGENMWEEINYEPAGRGGRNYGWRNREGAHDHNWDLPPAFDPLTDPIFNYDHGMGRCVSGGYVYRGSAVPAMAGRYVFGDFIRGHVWSVALTLDESGEAAASDFRSHTAEIAAGAPIGLISSFGVDANGELYVVNWGSGTIVALDAALPPPSSIPIIQIDMPASETRVTQPFLIAGWALDAMAPDRGIETLHVWAFPVFGGNPRFVGVANYGRSRPDVAASFGSQFGSAGFDITVKGLAPGDWWIVVYGLVSTTGTFSVERLITVTIDPSALMNIDSPLQSATVTMPFVIGGWALDPGAVEGTGVDAIHGWAFPVEPAMGDAVFLGAATFGSRPDVAAAFGAQFLNSGFSLTATGLPPGVWDVVLFGHSTNGGGFGFAQIVRVTVQ